MGKISDMGALGTYEATAVVPVVFGGDNYKQTVSVLVSGALGPTLTALEAYNTNGLLTQTAADTFTGRTLTGTANEVTVTNGDGVSGNPTVSLPAALTFTGKTVTGGTLTGATISSSAINTSNSVDVFDTTFSISDATDPTSIAKFDCTNIATATIRSFAFPNASGTLALLSDVSGGYQPLDSDLTTIAGLTATTDNFLQSKSSAWASRTPAQVAVDLQGTGLTVDMVGFRGIPQNSQSAAYTTVAADAGKHIHHPSTDANARTFTIDSNANVAYPIGTAITFTNRTSQVVTIAITSDTMYLGGTTTTGSRSLAENGIATALKVNSTTWIISGAGLT